MAAIQNYGELKSAVSNYLHRGDITNEEYDTTNAFTARDITSQLVDWSMFDVHLLTDSDRFFAESPEYSVQGFDPNFFGVEQIYYGDNMSGTFVTDTQNYGAVSRSSENLWRELRASGNAVNPSGYSVPAGLESIIFNVAPPTDSEFTVWYKVIDFGMTNDSDTTKSLVNNSDLWLYGMCYHLAILSQDIELAQVYKQAYDIGIQTATERTIVARDVGPAQIVGASQWV